AEDPDESTLRSTSDNNPSIAGSVSEELSAQMDSLIAGAQSRIRSGPAFQQELPGYFGGNLTEAGRVFLAKKRNQGLPHPPDRADLINRLLSAVSMCSAGQLNGARNQLEAIIDEDPENPTALFWLARVTRELGELEGSIDLLHEAHRLFKRTLAVDPENRDAFNMGVWCLIQLGAFEDALKALETWTRSREACAKNLELYGYLYAARISAGRLNPLHDLSRAFEYFDKSLEKNWNNTGLLEKLIEMSRQDQDRTRIERYTRQLDLLKKEGWRSP
ncbi:MAG: tetratricopeptide repeat protein, partial [Planctomycetota bacterium]